MDTGNNGLRLDAATRGIIDRLPKDERNRVGALIEKAAAHQRNELENALSDAMNIIPRPLKKRVRKLFLG